MSGAMGGGVYLLHFERPISEGRPAQHYLGYADDIERRIARHRSGAGARLVKAAMERGIEFVIAQTWPDADRAFERRLKRRKNARRQLCPICRAK